MNTFCGSCSKEVTPLFTCTCSNANDSLSMRLVRLRSAAISAELALRTYNKPAADLLRSAIEASQ